ncbi:hypothetical protein [Simkania negevensis]|uniref:Uncharacterized protein n=1 Tax=Simkania negevensis (strain ATCC VR-1471 / DSM 27360 / Z) TaxID=331113 RepID=F8L4T6_SIMNZ|nr:hypothetical protein [Simkania negevensis]CCB88671.1 unknown protein [Simkania negevensis Z]
MSFQDFGVMMTKAICPFSRSLDETYYPNGNLKSMTYFHPFGKLTTIGVPMATVGAAVNGLIAYISGANPLAASCIGALVAFDFCFFDFLGHQFQGETYHECTWIILARNVTNLSLNLFVCDGFAKHHQLTLSSFDKAWILLAPLAICQAVESLVFHKDSPID